ncbi:hypothetical protein [Nocardia iowensis]|uniref:Lipoprotein n=1 Tax=Nocardia iowensis TaxID=204891 RepID=A0ABX8RLZ4_NOCIO|nr:hypothetical protein [Nocardia iowensis]QXN90655.1 hypothetical protein KV110_35595 [Nocardia iowensis]
MRRLERTGLTVAALTTVAGVLIIGACSQQVSGTAEVNRTDLAAHTSEVTASAIAASAARAAAIERATGSACDAFYEANGNSVRVFNDYIAVSNVKGVNDPEANSKADVAVTTLRDGASAVDQQVTQEVPSNIADVLHTYRDDSRVLADTLARRADTDTLNATIDRFNATKDTALSACAGHGTR